MDQKTYICVELTHFKASMCGIDPLQTSADDVKECFGCTSRPPENLTTETKPHPTSHNHQGGGWGWG